MASETPKWCIHKKFIIIEKLFQEMIELKEILIKKKQHPDKLWVILQLRKLILSNLTFNFQNKNDNQTSTARNNLIKLRIKD